MRHVWIWVVLALLWWFWPEELAETGIWSDLTWLAVLLLVVTPVAVFIGVLNGLPNNVTYKVAPGAAITPALRDIVEEFEHQGFVRYGDPLRFQISQEALVIPLYKPDEGLLATAYRLGSNSGKVAFDVVTMIDVEEGSLTTAMDHGAGVLPGGPANLRQIFPGADVVELVHHHREALAFLDRQHIPTLDVAPSAIAALLCQSFASNRKWFLKSPIVNTFVAIWRTITKRNPWIGPLTHQTNILDHLAKVVPPHQRRKPAPRTRESIHEEAF